MQLWFILALMGAILWGLHYPLLEKGLESFSPLTLMFLTSFVMTVVILIFHKELYTELKSIYHANSRKKLILLGIVLTEFLGVYLVTKAISMGNATYVSLIEISYPIFVIIFSFLLFKVNHFNPSVVIGGSLVILGIGIIVWNDKSSQTNVIPESTAAACAIKECEKQVQTKVKNLNH